MWAGLLASSCTIDGRDESNLMFIHLLSQLTVSQVRIIDYACKTARIRKFGGGLLFPDTLIRTQDELKALSLIDDLHRLDRELDHLVSIGLLLFEHAGFDVRQQGVVGLTPSPLALQMYARCNGVAGDPSQYYVTLGTVITNKPVDS